MANRFKGEIAVIVDGKTYTLRMDMNAMCEFEDATGRPALETFAAIEAGNAKMSEVRAVIHAALVCHHPEATVQEAGDILSENRDVISELFAAAAPEPEPAGKGKAKATGSA